MESRRFIKLRLLLKAAILYSFSRHRGLPCRRESLQENSREIEILVTEMGQEWHERKLGDYHTYHSFSQSPFPMLPMPQTALLPYPLSHKYPSPLSSRSQIWDLFSCLLLGCLVNKPWLHRKPQMSQRFDLLCFWQREPGSDKSPSKEKSKISVRFLPQLSTPYGWQGLGAPAGCQAWASEVGEPSSGHWTTRDLLAPCNINWWKLSQWSPSQC